ncbi:cilia- and flagella-associated protein 100-like [Palaemon carinicauda]|uniref:cilia- and flagella-associated protein 100-like n=1 Tax=Palaemon carinicauda TaxID=392227 RepID=UPI0035B6544E
MGRGEQEEDKEAKHQDNDDDIEDDALALIKKRKNVVKGAFTKFKLSKEKVAKSPYKPPDEHALFEFSERTRRQLHQDFVQSGESEQKVSCVQRGQIRGAFREFKEEPLGPPRRRKAARATIQPQTARDYLLAARTTARDKNLTEVAEIEAQRLQKELCQERAINSELESQLSFHEAALQEFLQHHYRQVAEIVTKGDEAYRNLTEQEVKIDYFSGLLAESQTVQDEEKERLQDLTAFQQFLAAVTPAQSLKDLKRRTKEIYEEVQVSQGKDSHRTATDSVEVSQMAVELAISSSGISPIGGEGSASSALGADLLTLRMTRPPPPASRPPSRLDPQKTPSPPPQMAVAALPENNDSCDPICFDDFLVDNERLIALSHIYESQCHVLLALLTRLRGQTEAINEEVESRQKKLNTRLQEIQNLQEKASGNGHEAQLKDLCKLINEWPALSGDAQAQAQLDQLVAQIAEVVSDVFGSSEYSPLVPQAQQPPSSAKSCSTKSPVGHKGRSKPKEEIESPRHGTSEPANGTGSTVSAGMGQEALLALLEARVTDLCAILDTIDPPLRDAIFLNCEQARRARIKEEKRQEAEMRRAQRKQRHLERALAEPPPKPL